MNFDRFFQICTVASWIVVGIVFYFGDRTTSAFEVSSIRERVSVAEQKIEQETRGYWQVQAELTRRLERLENKVDQLLTRR
ncbi:hypothetical protein [Nitrospira sp. BLG_1]|uniref:hypothetical protein n=1 Tax=Nitrospira sp. BLG_1 TaxID=3395883 RepID=UPI0039BCE647